MGIDGFRDAPRTKTARELEIRFWTLVVLAKFVIMLVGVGLVLLAFTEYLAAGAAVTAIGLLVGLRWAQHFRKARREIARR